MYPNLYNPLEACSFGFTSGLGDPLTPWAPDLLKALGAPNHRGVTSWKVEGFGFRVQGFRV